MLLFLLSLFLIQPASAFEVNSCTVDTALSLSYGTPNTVMVLNGIGNVVSSPVTTTELDYIQNVTSDVQAQLNGKQSTLSFIDSLVHTAGSVSLVGDASSPGDSEYYGTNGSGTKGFYSFPPSVGSVTASAPIVSSGGLNPNITCDVASGSQAGCLSSTDWTTFNGKQSALTFGSLTDAGTDGITVTGGTGSVIGSGTSLSQHVADTTHNGYLASADWNTFNSKQSSLTPGSITTSTTGVSIGSGSSSTVGPNVTVNVQTASGSQPGLLASADWTTFNNKQAALSFSSPLVDTSNTVSCNTASGSQAGCLSSTDWTTFNGKQAAGNYITALTGDGTASGPGSAALTLATVNSNTGSFTNASITVNGKGLITAASNGTTGNLTDAGTDGITVTGGTGAVLGSGTSFAQHVADTTHNGYLASSDWNTFNGKQAAGNYITALTGDVTASGPGSAASTLATVNSNVGSFNIANVTVNAKGLVTAASASSTTGSGNVVLATSPTLVTPTLGVATGTSLALSNTSNPIIEEINTGAQSSAGGAGLSLFSDPGAAISSGSRLGFLGLGGSFDTSHTLNNTTAVQAYATQNWSSSAKGSELVFSVTNNSTTGLQTALTLNQDQSATFANTVNATTFVGALTGNASTATALASVPTGCSAGQYADSIAASGNLTCAQVNYNQLTGVLPNPTATSLGGIESLASTSHEWINAISTSGVPSATQPAFSDISGSVAASQLPNPTATSLGGIESLASTSHEWINAISTSGVPSATQPAFSDISGSATASQLPTATTSAIGGVEIITSATSHQWVSSWNSSGVPQTTQPAFTDISGNLALSSIASIATNTILGNNTGGGAAPTALTVSQVNTMLGTLSNPMTTAGDMIYGGSSGTPTRLAAGTSGQVPISAGTSVAMGSLPGNSTALKAPTGTNLTSTGTQTGWLFTISTSTTCAVGDTYTNNGHTYTVQGALSAQSGAVLWMSGTGATSGTTLSRSTGSGTSSVTFSATTATATYTTPTSPSPLYLRINMIGGGGGGSGSGNSSTMGPGGNGVTTYFGPNILSAGGGVGGPVNGNGGSNSSGSCGSVSPCIALPGAGGSGAAFTDLSYTGAPSGAPGASSPLGGGGGTGQASAIWAGLAAPANTGAGGGGAATGNGAPTGYAGSGGGAGAFIFNAIISSPAVSYPYIIGSGGSGGSAGTNGAAGGAGGSGFIGIEEHYQ